MNAEIAEIFNYIRKQKNNICNLDQLKDNYGKIIHNIEELILSNNCYFYVKKITATKWRIRSKIPIKLCYTYQRQGNCDGSCDQLHLCKTHLCFHGACDETCEFSHDLSDEHNGKILDKFKIRNEHIDIVRSSFPRICREFVTDGNCKHFNCCALHICPDYVKECCQSPCSYALKLNIHESLLHGISIRNQSILSSFQLLPNEIFANCLVKFHDVAKTKGLIVTSSALNSVQSQPGSISQSIREIYDAKRQTERIKTKSRRNVILEIILENDPDKGSCPLLHSKILSLFDNDITVAEEYFRSNKTSFRLAQNRDGDVFVYACIAAVAPCIFYWGKSGGCRKKCGQFHVCRRYIYGNHNAKTCTFNHLDDYFTQKLIVENDLETFSKEQILTLLRNRYPFICEAYQTGDCKQGNYCQDFHICKKYKTGKCIQCNLPHNDAYDSFQAARLADSFNLGIPKLLHDFVIIKMDETRMNDDEDREKRMVVIKRILDINPREGCCLISNPKLLSLFDNNETLAEDYFLNHAKSFRLVENIKGDTLVHVFLKFIEPCSYYWTLKGKTCVNCKRFHVCKWYYIFREVHKQDKCGACHLDDPKSKELIENNKLEDFTTGQILTLLRKRYPFVCDKFQNGNCEDGDEFCLDLHICKKFKLGRCNDFDKVCDLPHQSAFTSLQAKKIANSYHLQLKYLHLYLFAQHSE